MLRKSCFEIDGSCNEGPHGGDRYMGPVKCRSHMTSALALCRRLGSGQCRIPCIRLAAEEQYNYDSYSYKAKGDKAALFDWVGGFR